MRSCKKYCSLNFFLNIYQIVWVKLYYYYYYYYYEQKLEKKNAHTVRYHFPVLLDPEFYGMRSPKLLGVIHVDTIF